MAPNKQFRPISLGPFSLYGHNVSTPQTTQSLRQRRRRLCLAVCSCCRILIQAKYICFYLCSHNVPLCHLVKGCSYLLLTFSSSSFTSLCKLYCKVPFNAAFGSSLRCGHCLRLVSLLLLVSRSSLRVVANASSPSAGCLRSFLSRSRLRFLYSALLNSPFSWFWIAFPHFG